MNYYEQKDFYIFYLRSIVGERPQRPNLEIGLFLVFDVAEYESGLIFVLKMGNIEQNGDKEKNVNNFKNNCLCLTRCTFSND